MVKVWLSEIFLKRKSAASAVYVYTNKEFDLVMITINNKQCSTINMYNRIYKK